MLLGEKPVLLIWTLIVAAPAVATSASEAAAIASMAATILIFVPPLDSVGFTPSRFPAFA